MNSSVMLGFIQAEIENDPDAARSEWLALFREDVEAAFSLESIEACVVTGRTELMAAERISYVAFVDPSGGRHDQFAVAIAHLQTYPNRSPSSRVVVDLIKSEPS